MGNNIDPFRNAVEEVITAPKATRISAETADRFRRDDPEKLFKAKLKGRPLEFLGESRPKNYLKSGGRGRALVFGLGKGAANTPVEPLTLARLADTRNVVTLRPPRRAKDGRTIRVVELIVFKNLVAGSDGYVITFGPSGVRAWFVLI